MYMLDFNTNFSPPSTLDIGEMYAGFGIRGGMLLSNATAHSAVSYSRIKFVVANPGTVTIWASVSSEASYDYLVAHINKSSSQPAWSSGVDRVFDISGNVAERTYTYNITTPGTYWLHLSYRKDSSGSSGEDVGRIHRIQFPIETPGSYIKANGAWVASKSEKIKVNSSWASSRASYIKVNGAWVKYKTTSPTASYRLAFAQERHESSYGFVNCNYDSVFIGSGYSGTTSDCIARSTNAVQINAGDVITVSIFHSAVSGSDSYNTSTSGQSGTFFIGTGSSFSSPGTRHNVYLQSRTPGTGQAYFSRSLTVPTSGTYYFFGGLTGSSTSYDTHLGFTDIRVNGARVF